MGFLLPLCFMGIWLLNNDLYQMFMQNMLSFGGKNPSISNLLASIPITVFAYASSVLPIAFMTFLALIVYSLASKNHHPLLGPSFAIVSGVIVFNHFWISLEDFQKSLIATTFLIAVALSLLMKSRIAHSNFSKFLPSMWMAFLAFTQSLASLTEPRKIESLISLGFQQSFFTGCTILITCLATYNLLDRPSKQNAGSTSRATSRTIEASPDEKLLNILFAAGTFAAFINLLSSGGTTYLIWFVASFLFFTSYAVGLLGVYANKLFIFALFSVVSLGMVSNYATGIANPYVWWGWREPSLIQPADESALIGLADMRPSKEVNDFYEDIYSYIQEAERSIDATSPMILTIGAIPMITTISGMDPYEGLYCKVQWFDLCPNDVLLADLDIIKKSPPNILVFQEISELAYTSHETGFLKSRSALRDYKDFRDQQVALDNWVEVGRAKTPGKKGDLESGFGVWDVIVYKVEK
jgi:hypothetical protein